MLIVPNDLILLNANYVTDANKTNWYVVHFAYSTSSH